MKILIGSDIHGSACYCKKLFEAYEREKAGRMLLLGDLLYHGPRNDLPREYAPKQVIEMLNAHSSELLCVRGNCEAEVDQMVLDVPVLAEYAVFSIGNHIVFATHGHVFHPGSLPPLKPGDILLNGHTHVPACEKIGEVMYLNPGSLSIPKEGSAHSYMIWEGVEFCWRDLETGETYRTYTHKE